MTTLLGIEQIDQKRHRLRDADVQSGFAIDMGIYHTRLQPILDSAVEEMRDKLDDIVDAGMFLNEVRDPTRAAVSCH